MSSNRIEALAEQLCEALVNELSYELKSKLDDHLRKLLDDAVSEALDDCSLSDQIEDKVLELLTNNNCHRPVQVIQEEIFSRILSLLDVRLKNENFRSDELARRCTQLQQDQNGLKLLIDTLNVELKGLKDQTADRMLGVHNPLIQQNCPLWRKLWTRLKLWWAP